jgi:pimeloyl-ACP methyl ester carboxylesterase
MVNATLVTIHGFWSSPATWDRLSEIWSADEQLDGLQIHSFGYLSPKIPTLPFSTTRVPDYNDIAQALATEYTVELSGAPGIAIVTHSQGGLILQRFLTWMLDQRRGRELGQIRTIVMLACPNGGSEYLRSIRNILGFGHNAQAGSLEVLNRQVADTQRAVLQRIVNATGVDEYQCRIPFHVYAGDSDNVVTAASAQGAFPGASVLPGNHFSILDPAAPGNRTAKTLKYHLLTDFAASPLRNAGESSVEPSVRDLALRYNVLRETMPSGDPRTIAMAGIVRELRNLLRDVPDFDVARYLSSSDRGLRLAAYAYLQEHEDLQYRSELVSVVCDEDKPFGQYTGLEALRNQGRAAERLDEDDLRKLSSLARRLNPGEDLTKLVNDIIALERSKR